MPMPAAQMQMPEPGDELPQQSHDETEQEQEQQQPQPNMGALMYTIAEAPVHAQPRGEPNMGALMDTIRQSSARLEDATAAYSQLMQLMAMPSQDRQRCMPVLTWPCRLGEDDVIEVNTDLGLTDPNLAQAALHAMATVHPQEMAAASSELAQASTQYDRLLQAALAAQQQ
jgi:hypothetical protein